MLGTRFSTRVRSCPLHSHQPRTTQESRAHRRATRCLRRARGWAFARTDHSFHQLSSRSSRQNSESPRRTSLRSTPQCCWARHRAYAHAPNQACFPRRCLSPCTTSLSRVELGVSRETVSRVWACQPTGAKTRRCLVELALLKADAPSPCTTSTILERGKEQEEAAAAHCPHSADLLF